MKTNKLLLSVGGAILLGTGIWYFVNQQQKRTEQKYAALYARLQQQNVIAPKTNKATDVAAWISAILSAGMSIYGSAAPLFQPGGPFYKKKPSAEVLALLQAKGVNLPLIWQAL